MCKNHKIPFILHALICCQILYICCLFVLYRLQKMHLITDLRVNKPLLSNVIIVNYDHMFYSWKMWLVNLNYTRRSRKLICKWEENCSYCQTFSPELFQFNAKLYLLLLINKKFVPAARMIQFFANHLDFYDLGYLM